MKAGWEVKALSEITTKIGSGATPRGGQAAYKAEGISLIRSLNVHDLWFKENNLAFIDDEQAEALSNVTVQSGDVLLNITGASIARCCIAPDDKLPARVNQHVSILRPHPETVSSKYLAYLLTSKEQKDRLLGIGDDAGSTRQALTKSHLQSYTIPLPPLEEQKRIVAVLDGAFEGLTRARTHIETNLQNARELFESVLQHSFSQTESWETAELNEHVKFVDYRGKTPPKRPEGVRLITAKNVKRGYIRRNPEEYIDADAYEGWMTRGFPEKGDVLFTTEAPLANVAQLDTDEKVVIGQRLITMKADKTILDHTFLAFSLMSPQMQERIISQGTGATVLGIKAKLLKVIPLHFPKSLADQREIAKRCREVSAHMDELQSIFNKKLQDLDDLRQSLLQKAFAGELT
nr:restriction endonuclease subunit S [Amylibacter sp.]